MLESQKEYHTMRTDGFSRRFLKQKIDFFRFFLLLTRCYVKGRNMKKKINYDKLNSICDDFEGFIPFLEEEVTPYYLKKKKVVDSIMHELSYYPESEEPEILKRMFMVLNQYIYAYVFSNPEEIKKVLKNPYFSKIDRFEKDKINYFVDNPCYYTIFDIKEIYDEDYYLIHDYIKNKDYLLKSDSIINLIRIDAVIFIQLVFFNGECLQTIGPYYYSKSFIPDDFFYLFSLLDDNYEKGNEITNVIINNFVYYKLFLIQDVPKMKFLKLEETPKKILVLNLFTGNDKIILPHQNKITTIFTKPQEKK